MALQEATKLFQQLQVAFKKNDLKGADSLLSQLKLKLIQLPSLPPVFQTSPTAAKELSLAREVLEHAVLISLKAKDDAAMERSFTQLKTFYVDTRGMLPASQQELPMTGLNLLRLLVQNRIAEFHTELELIPPEVQADPSIKHAIQLEQWLMEGAYNKVLDASRQLPSEYHAGLMQQLASTVRDEVASCSEKAYLSLKLKDAQKLMMFDSVTAVREYAGSHGWKIEGEQILFQGQEVSAAAKDLPSLALIHNSLVYAKELERIV